MTFTNLLCVSAFALTVAACSQPETGRAPDAAGQATPAAKPADAKYPMQAYYGDTHVHTGWSVDAGLDGAITGPEEAFRVARGDSVKSNTGRW